MSAVALLTPIEAQPAASTPTRSDTLPCATSGKALRLGIGAVLIAFVTTLLIVGLDAPNLPARTALAIFAATLIAWTVMDLPDTPVALSGALAMVLGGAVGEDVLFAAMGNQLIWLLIAAFVIAGVLRQTGITERLAFAALERFTSVSGVFWASCVTIAATAFVIPSTSARAAMLVPVFLGLSAAIGRASVSRALALLFASTILLSACASMIGAGAHLIAADFVTRLTGKPMDFAYWALLGAPFGLLTSLLACGLIQLLFLSADDRRASVAPGWHPQSAPARNQGLIIATIALTIALWATSGLHGIDMAVIALVAALVVGSRLVSGIALKTALKAVEWNLLLFLAATLVMGEALLSTGAADFVATGMVELFATFGAPAPWMVVLFAACISAAAHLLIASRTARASVLIPAVALPLAGFGLDPAALVMLVTIGSGFCQTLMVSAKPIMLFAGLEPTPFSQRDLLLLSAPLLPAFVGLLVAMVLFVWPLLGLPIL